LEECLEKFKKKKAIGCHTHGLLTTLRGFQRMAVYTNDNSWNELPEYYRNMIIREHWENAIGDVCESLPYSRRNEACATSDWMMMNLWSAYINNDDKAYAEAEHILWNAVFFNQIITGGSGHRSVAPWGYTTKEFQEAWWCCTETAILGMSEYAKHAVTFKDGTLRINFLIPGEYTDGDMTVTISTMWPAKADTTITVKGCPDPIYVRIPEDIRNAKEERVCSGNVTTIRLRGEIGHTVEQWKDNLYILKYGPLILAPSNYVWEANPYANSDNGIPEGYLSSDFPSVDFRITLPGTDENGFYKFQHLPFPDWVYYDEGPESRTSFEGVSVNVELNFEDHSVKTARFWPLCYNISTLTFYEIPVVFRTRGK
ncbi:MAG: glycoside hydrolase family 127 protein, partial [Eubacteriales bacterium]|nr:glycoside hydrolase family 127 protein [Eubacteriales bacterium]